MGSAMDDLPVKTSLQILEEFAKDNWAALESLGEWVGVHDVDGTIVFISEAYIRSSGLKKEQIVGQRNMQFFAPEFQPMVPQIVNVVLSGNTWYGKVPLRIPDGHCFYGWVDVSPLYGGNKEIIGIVTMAFDLITGKSVDSAQGVPNQIIDRILEGFTIDTKRIITFISEKAANLIGREKSEMLGRSIFRFIAATDYDRTVKLFSFLFDNHSYQGELQFQDKEGSPRLAWVSLKPIIDKNNRVIGISQEQAMRILNAEEIEAFHKRPSKEANERVNSPLSAGAINPLMNQLLSIRKGR